MSERLEKMGIYLSFNFFQHTKSVFFCEKHWECFMPSKLIIDINHQIFHYIKRDPKSSAIFLGNLKFLIKSLKSYIVIRWCFGFSGVCKTTPRNYWRSGYSIGFTFLPRLTIQKLQSLTLPFGSRQVCAIANFIDLFSPRYEAKI